jgi:hypothetical protein
MPYEVFQCANIANKNESGVPCNKKAPNNFSQHVNSNVKSDSYGKTGVPAIAEAAARTIVDVARKLSELFPFV